MGHLFTCVIVHMVDHLTDLPLDILALLHEEYPTSSVPVVLNEADIQRLIDNVKVILHFEVEWNQLLQPGMSLIDVLQNLTEKKEDMQKGTVENS